MALLESLLSAIVRADGDALVMHVGERPYVVVGTQTTNISTHPLNFDVMMNMLAQLLPAEQQGQLEELGAVEYRTPFESEDRFTLVAARGGDDVWIEIRRRRPQPTPAAPPIAAPMEIVAARIEVVTPAEIAAPVEVAVPTEIAAPVEVAAPMEIAAPVEIVVPFQFATPPPPSPEGPAAAAEIEPAPSAGPAVVVPLIRPPRTDAAPSPTSPSTSTDVERLLRIAAARGASAVFLTSGTRPSIRIEGDLRQLESEPVMSSQDIERAILEITPELSKEAVARGVSNESIIEVAGLGRIRCTTFVDHRGAGLLLNMISTRAATAEQLDLSPEVRALATEPQGLVLIAGPRSSGKSTLLSALIDLVNRQRNEFVIVLERQIRLVHEHRMALVSQREIRGGAEESVKAARAALREKPEVLVVDDLVSPQMVPLLLAAASEGLLVFVSISAPSTSDAVARFIELAPPEMRAAVQAAMAESFRGGVAQVLLKKSGGGTVAAREVLLATATVARLLGEGQLDQLPLVFDSGRKHGMVSFTDALVDLVRAGMVDMREAFRKAPDRERLLERLKRDGIDTTAVERLA
jgi:twitching motility protein PilT